MTGEEFRSLYRLGERLTKPPVVTHRATDLSGAPVLVHFLLESTEGGGNRYLDGVARLESPANGLVREVVEVEGRSVVVTEVLEGFSTFQEWLEEVETPGVAPNEPPSNRSGEPDRSETREPGAYTQLFKAPETSSEVLSPEAPTPNSEPPREMTPPMPPEPEGKGEAPGSYTMLFGGGAGPEDQGEAPVSATQGVPSPGPPEPPQGQESPQGQEPPRVPEIPEVPELPTDPEHSGVPEAPGAGLDPDTPGDQEPVPSAPVFPTPKPEKPADPERADGSPGSPLPWEAGVDESPPAEVSEESPGPRKEKEGHGKPGAYTQIFGRPAPGSGAPPVRPPPGGRGTAPPSPSQPGPQAQSPTPGDSPPNWQRWKDTPGASGRHIPSDDYLHRLGGASTPMAEPTRSDSRPAEGHGQGASPSSDLLGGPEAPTGPGHYTMIREGFSADPTPPPPMTQPSSGPSRVDTGATPAAMPSRRASLLTILGLVAVFLTIVALVIVFAVFG